MTKIYFEFESTAWLDLLRRLFFTHTYIQIAEQKRQFPLSSACTWFCFKAEYFLRLKFGNSYI